MKMREIGLLLIVFLLGMTGCGNENVIEIVETVEEEIKIPVIFRVDPATNVADNEDFEKEFNEAYEGIYELDVEWLSETSAGYRNKLKQWNVLDEMPVLITDAGFDNDFYEVLVEDARLVNLRPYMEASDFWMDVMKEDILEQCSEEDGSIYLAPLSESIDTYAGIIYNEEMLAEAGYEKFPDTWEDFFECLENLKNLGYTPLALHGAGSYWVPMLFATAYLERTEEGKAFLGTEYPESFQTPEMEAMFEMLSKLYEYSFEDAVELDYDQAAERFFHGEAAIIANGKWMFSAMSEENKETFQFTSFPGGILMNAPKMGAWAVTEGYSEEVTEAAVKVLEFRIQSEQENLQKAKNGEYDSSLEQSYFEAVWNVETIMPNYQMQWEQEIQNEFFTEYLPGLVKGEMDVRTLLILLDKRIDKIESKK